MTVMAWDGRVLAADKRANVNGLVSVVTKIKKSRGHLLFCAGNFAYSMQLYDWFDRGAKIEDFPEFNKIKDSWEALNVITPERRLLRYEMTPYPMELEVKQFACGSGRDYAIAAMRLGKNSVQAVMLASEFDPYCGNGVDVLAL